MIGIEIDFKLGFLREYSMGTMWAETPREKSVMVGVTEKWGLIAKAEIQKNGRIARTIVVFCPNPIDKATVVASIQDAISSRLVVPPGIKDGLRQAVPAWVEKWHKENVSEVDDLVVIDTTSPMDETVPYGVTFANYSGGRYVFAATGGCREIVVHRKVAEAYRLQATALGKAQVITTENLMSAPSPKEYGVGRYEYLPCRYGTTLRLRRPR